MRPSPRAGRGEVVFASYVRLPGRTAHTGRVRLRTSFDRLLNSNGRQRVTAREREALAGTALVVGGLGLLNVVKHVRPSAGLPLSVGATASLLVLARRSGLSWEQLGLGRERLRHGAVAAAAATAVVAATYLPGVLHPRTRAAFLDTRYQLAAPQALSTAFVGIPLGTVLLEEVAFRSVLWGMLSRHVSPPGVVLASSSLFGLWHVLPSLDFASANRGLAGAAPDAGASGTVLVTLGTVAFTALGGVVAGELRRRSGSVVSSAGMHWATNGLGVLFGLAAWKLERRGTGLAGNGSPG